MTVILMAFVMVYNRGVNHNRTVLETARTGQGLRPSGTWHTSSSCSQRRGYGPCLCTARGSGQGTNLDGGSLCFLLEFTRERQNPKLSLHRVQDAGFQKPPASNCSRQDSLLASPDCKEHKSTGHPRSSSFSGWGFLWQKRCFPF